MAASSGEPSKDKGIYKQDVFKETMIGLINSRPLIWQPKDKNHMDKALVKAAWDSILAELHELFPGMLEGCDVERLKAVWKNLKDTFNDIERKRKKVPSGSAAQPPPKWAHYNAMMFMSSTNSFPPPTSSADENIVAIASEIASDTQIFVTEEEMANIEVTIAPEGPLEMNFETLAEKSSDIPLDVTPTPTYRAKSSLDSALETPDERRRKKKGKEKVSEEEKKDLNKRYVAALENFAATRSSSTGGVNQSFGAHLADILDEMPEKEAFDFRAETLERLYELARQINEWE